MGSRVSRTAEPLAIGDRFDTHAEQGCVVVSLPDKSGEFTAYDSDGVLCSFNVVMVSPRTLSCGCCVAGCVCWNHQDTPRGVVPGACPYHRKHGHPYVTTGVR